MTGKLVRDDIPQIIRAAGAQPLIRVAASGEYRGLLRDKLTEEVREFLSFSNPEELADILEVILALASDLGIDRASLEQIRAQKAAERGSFTRRYVWSGNLGQERRS